MFNVNINKYRYILEKDYVRKLGKVSRVVGLTIEADGPDVSIGNCCKINTKDGKSVLAEVVGFKDKKILLMPYGDIEGVGLGSIVQGFDYPLNVKVSNNLLGRVLNGLGEPMDHKGPIEALNEVSTTNVPPDPLSRSRIKEQLSLGVKAIDGLLSIGKGQRVGIFAGSGVGKSTLMGMIARNTSASINVIALIGERGREVKEFIEKDLGEEGLKRSVLVIATSDQPALVRLKAAQVATSIAEYFREQGNDVLLLMDSLTRYAMAQREVGLAIGEPPVSRGYTPSVFSIMPKLLERAGNSDKGSITGLYTVLVDGDDLTEPVTDTARGILDGHIVLSRKLANKNHYPAIDVLASVSRVMSDIVTKEHKKNAFEIKKLMGTYSEAEDLINVGAYVSGSNEDIDMAISKRKPILEFLTQSTEDSFSLEEVDQQMIKILEE
ncbi:flagellar protein export ATPase FliI [uncultured Tyzzerella sp.]|uniref:flagellar protein export ATPase FliI n=1 Tax=uncultured Tyzzerella sp. TaxID=2321398 RepID=UPI0029422746|nr:flagellar protein export ATPase FliI [uncultured Tyzzerella sp.]